MRPLFPVSADRKSEAFLRTPAAVHFICIAFLQYGNIEYRTQIAAAKDGTVFVFHPICGFFSAAA
jgi:hypothetical protein